MSASEPRTLARVDYLSLCAATRDLVEANGGYEAAGASTRVSFQRLANYAANSDPSFMPVDIVADLERKSGEPCVTRRLARLAGYLLVKLPEGGERDDVWTRHLSELATLCADLMRDIAAALADNGIVDRGDLKRLPLRDDIAVLQQYLAAIDRLLADIELAGDADELQEARSGATGKHQEARSVATGRQL